MGRLPTGAPSWPVGVVGAIAHAAGCAAAMLGMTVDLEYVGLDIESVQRWFPELMDTVALPEERAWLRGLDSDARPRIETALFSAKEAVYKAFAPSVGYFGFEAVAMEPAAGGFVARFTADVGHPALSGTSFPVGVQFVGELVLTTVTVSTAT